MKTLFIALFALGATSALADVAKIEAAYLQGTVPSEASLRMGTDWYCIKQNAYGNNLSRSYQALPELNFTKLVSHFYRSDLANGYLSQSKDAASPYKTRTYVLNSSALEISTAGQLKYSDPKPPVSSPILISYRVTQEGLLIGEASVPSLIFNEYKKSEVTWKVDLKTAASRNDYLRISYHVCATKPEILENY